MIRLGSLAGYPFEGPRRARRLDSAGPVAAVYAILCKPDPRQAEQYAVIYVGQSDDLSAERFPFNHPRAALLGQARRRPVQALICTYEVPGGLPSHREQIAA